MRNRREFKRRLRNIVQLSGRRKGAVLKEEAWFDGDEVVKYSLVYINHLVMGRDNGRVLGYDNGHGYHHRHFMGKVETFEFTTFEEVLKRFEAEVHALWREEDGE